jgi:uncharacterized membrane protein YoaK (UPF0700 family)
MRLAGERNVLPAKTPDEMRGVEVGKSGETFRILDWNTTTWVWIIIVPIAVWCLLLVLMPTFVKRYQNESKLDHQSLLLWTLILSLVIWILFFGFAKCKSC